MKKGFRIGSLFYFFTFMKTRIYYFLLVCFILIVGLVSRKIDFIHLAVGDILYAMMIYFMIRFLFIKSKPISVAFLSLLLCFAIEFSQLYQARWIVEIRSTTLGHLVLGQGFLLSDLLAYTFGILLSFISEKYLPKR